MKLHTKYGTFEFCAYADTNFKVDRHIASDPTYRSTANTVKEDIEKLQNLNSFYSNDFEVINTFNNKSYKGIKIEYNHYNNSGIHIKPGYGSDPFTAAAQRIIDAELKPLVENFIQENINEIRAEKLEYYKNEVKKDINNIMQNLNQVLEII